MMFRFVVRACRAPVATTLSVCRTLFNRRLDDLPEVLIASALADAERRGIDAVCLFLSYSADPQLLRTFLSDPRIATVGTKDRSYPSLLPEDLKNNPRVGRYWEPGVWALPAGSTHVYFVGSWRVMTLGMLREATRCNVRTLRVRVATSWSSVPLAPARFARSLARALYRRVPFAFSFARVVVKALRSAWWLLRRLVAGLLTLLRPNSIELALRIAGPTGLAGRSLPQVLGRMIQAVEPMDAVSRRVVHVCGSLQPGGAERQLAYTLQGLAQANLESVQLLCHNLAPGGEGRYDFYLSQIRRAGVNVREIRRLASAHPTSMPEQIRDFASSLPSGLAVDISNLYWEFMELRPDIVHAWLDWDNVRAGLAAVLAGVPKVILSCRNINPRHFVFYQPYMDPAYRVLARIPAVIFLNNSRAGADDYADWIGIPRTRINVVHNGVDFGTQARLAPDGAIAFRRSIGIPTDAFVVGGVFRLDEEKRPLLWLKTAALVAREVKNAWFMIVGHGRLHDQVRRCAKQLDLENRLILSGVTDQVLCTMSIMDVMLLTSLAEGLPNVLLEAQWVGTPVVTTDVGGTKEAINPGVTGWVVTSDQASALAERIIWLNQNPELRAEVRDHGPAFVREQFGVAHMISNTMKIYGY